jgi:uncharacterized protein
LFDWDDANVGHLARHGLRPADVEQALADPDAIYLDARMVRGEPRWRLLGRTNDGRVLAMVLALIRSRLRVVTAYPARPSQRRVYRQRREEEV